MRRAIVLTGVAVLAFGAFAQQAGGKEEFLRKQAYAEMQRVAGQVDLIQNNQDDLARRLSETERVNASLRSEIAALRAEIDSLRSDMSGVRNEARGLRQDLAADLKKLSASRDRGPQPTVSGPYKEYVVESGDTLFVVAQACGTTVKKIKDMNGLKSDSLRVGQKLKIPVEK